MLMDSIFNWLFDDIKYAAIAQRTLYRHLIKESSVEATTTIVDPNVCRIM